MHTFSLRDLAGRAFRFGFAGILVTLLHVLIAAGLIEFVDIAPALANGIAFSIAVFASYVSNTFWSFARKPALGSLARFVIVSILGLGVTVAVSGLAAEQGLSYWIGIGCVVLIVPPLTFLLHNFWTYR
ncbi:GtrA family protein [Dongia sp.]|uniref:GtrA family protein n=1 Tax=Dongia sp. TaxID=1977262 RepID=UPI0035B2F851